MRTAKVKLILAFIAIAVQANANLQDTTARDSSYYAALIGDQVNKIIAPSKGPTWVIAGKDSHRLYRISAKGEVLNVGQTLGIDDDVIFTDLIPIKSRRILVGTKNRYAFLLHNKHVEWLNTKYGLMDSTVLSIKFNSKQKLMEVETPNHRYLVKHHNMIRNIRFIEIRDTASTFDEISDFLKRNFRWSIQKGICQIAADIDFSFREQKYIHGQELEEIKSQLQPGDIIIKRNDAQLSNVGIPGFWTHSGIYIGSLNQLDSLYSGLQMLGGQLPSEYIRENYPEVHEKMYGRSNLIIEAIGKGVVINPLEHIAKVDYLAALRTNLKCDDIFKSLLSAFEYLGTPYDYLFDFSNDNELVCSELVCLSFSSSPNKQGVNFSMGSLGGKSFLSPNDIAKQFDTELHKEGQQLHLVFFYDAESGNKKSIKRNESSFARSWKRH